ncbi:coagulation factor XIII A chain-like isoform X2 [Sardina pilchardus]|uniref:coagulation factor XIII A chain-like isoform X2 n=1 Tax=Sardina pilchardus TaxID=27697 RepID=UPI002E0EE8CA
MEHPKQLLPDFNMRYRGKQNAPKGTSDAEKDDLPEFEPFKGALPRGPITSNDQYGLKLVKLDLHKSVNTREHRTDKFKHHDLIIRRGQKFTMTLTFNRPYDVSTDYAMLEFVIGKNSRSGKATYNIVLLNKCPYPDDCKNMWERGELNLTYNRISVDITPSAKSIVGKYHVYLTVSVPHWGKQRTDLETDIYVLFNAWCQDDDVFLNDEAQRNEYVLNERGIIFNGETNHVSSRPWDFGQFKHGVLDACFHCLNMSEMVLEDRKKVALVARRASQMVNALDDNGVLVGNWSGNYAMGTPPAAWTGSAEILLQYKRNSAPVSYAQCWVYAGVLNTVLRCLGIPSRVVTNFNSAHDTNGNLTLDIFVDEDGSMNRDYTNDSVWNYHCWNEGFMKRTDLNSKYWGWQVVDATPQETSKGLFQCGPTSVKAIKEGQVCLQYDGKFVFAEVNSDVAFKMVDKHGLWKTVQVNTSHVGTKIVTKAVHSNAAENIKDSYKYPEGSRADLATMAQATSFGCERDPFYRSSLQETDVDIELMAPAVQLGQNFYLTLEVQNKSLEQRTVQLSATCCVTYYTGVDYGTFKEERKLVSLGPSMTEKVNIEILANEYMGHMVDQGSLKFICVGKVQENNQVLGASKVVLLEVPILSLKLHGEVKVNQEMSVTLEFTNIFNVVLEHVNLRMEGPGEIGLKKKYYEYVSPGASLTWTESFVPDMPGTGGVVGSLVCPKLSHVYGELDFDAQP